MKLHIDCIEEKLAEMDYIKEENFELKEKLKELNTLKNENLALVTIVKQNEENLSKMQMKINKLEEISKSVMIPVNVKELIIMSHI